MTEHKSTGPRPDPTQTKSGVPADRKAAEGQRQKAEDPKTDVKAQKRERDAADSKKLDKPKDEAKGDKPARKSAKQRQDEENERQRKLGQEEPLSDMSLAERRDWREEERAKQSRPGDPDLRGNEIDREGPICEVPDCEIQQSENHDGLCPMHEKLSDDPQVAAVREAHKKVR